MTTWTSDELTWIGTAEEVEIATRRTDWTLRPPRTVWVVRFRNDLFVRSVNGTDARWYRGTRSRHEGRIDAAGIGHDVVLVDTGGEGADRVDAEYREKYGRYATSIIDAITGPAATAMTIKRLPAAHR